MADHDYEQPAERENSRPPSERFPDMTPIMSPPGLSSVNGIGCTAYGSRDYDSETNTYVKTQCFIVFFMPVFALAAYRVADAQQGWYFIGRVPLSAFAKTWNCFMLCVIFLGGGSLLWEQHTKSPEYIARQKMHEAEELVEANQLGAAASLYREVAAGATEYGPQAVVRVQGLIDGPVHDAPLSQAVEVFKAVADLHNNGKPIANAFACGLALVRKHGAAEPRTALALLDAITPLAPQADDCLAPRRQILEQLVAQHPEDADAASQLAVVYESQKELARCEKLLTPHEKTLGIREGARILGHLYAEQGKLDQAHALLLPYAEGRLTKLHEAEKSLQAAYEGAQGRVLASLKSGLAPGFDYNRYKSANQVDQESMVNEYFNSAMQNDAGITSARAALVQEASVVPVALDLGIVLLRRGQGMNDPAQRRAELEKAEKTFLAIRGVAGQSDEYRLYLGQVYYWLGKQAEGRKLIDELLEAQKRDSKVLLGVARILREVGDRSGSRALAEEAYEKEADPKKKYEAALLRAVTLIDLDDEITWLERSNPADTHVKASLSTARGNKALIEGKDADAEKYLRQAVELYARQTESAATLNNGALAYFSLFRATRQRADLDKGMAMLDKAVALEPSDSILLSNASHSILEGAARDLIGDLLDLKVLNLNCSLDLLDYFYQDQAGYQQQAIRIRKHAGIAKAISYLERTQVLAPKSADSYSNLFSIHGRTRNRDALRQLLQRLEDTELDQAQANKQLLDYYQGKIEERYVENTRHEVARYEKVLEAARTGPKGATLAVAAHRLADAMLHLDYYGHAINLDEYVRLCEEAHAAAPSSKTHSHLVSALFERAGHALVRQDPAYAAMHQRARRALGHSYLIAIALSQDSTRPHVLLNKDAQRAIDLMRDSTRRFPSGAGEWTYTVLHAAHPEDADKLLPTIQKNEVMHLQRDISVRLSPLRATAAFDSYWSLQLLGNDAKARESLKACVSRGVPMPFDVK